MAYEHGEGVVREPARAAALHCESARLGNKAMYSFGWMYANGRGLGRSDASAGTSFAMAAFLGHAQADQMRGYTGEYVGAVPASACLSTAMIWLSENLDFFIL